MFWNASRPVAKAHGINGTGATNFQLSALTDPLLEESGQSKMLPKAASNALRSEIAKDHPELERSESTPEQVP